MKNMLSAALCALHLISLGQQAYDWVSLPQSVNGGVQSVCAYNGSLIAAGSFSMAGNIPVNNIAAWNGTSWSALGKGLRGGENTAQRVFVFNNELYATGGFDSAGTVATGSIARWDGTAWHGFGTGTNGLIYSLAMYNNQLHASGGFDTICGTPARYVARWDGSAWHPLAGGLHTSVVFGAIDLCVYQNELYVAGDIDSADGRYAKGIARWNGTAWDSVGPRISYINYGMIVWNNKLLVPDVHAVPAVTMRQWDGQSWSVLSQQPMFHVRRLLIYNNRLYCSGGNLYEKDETHVAVWDPSASKWHAVGNGVSSYIRGLCEYNGELYCGGYFNTGNGDYHNYIARLANVTGIDGQTGSKSLGVNMYPIPTSGHLNVEFNGLGSAEISIYDLAGRRMPNLTIKNKRVDLSGVSPGVYFLVIKTEQNEMSVRKIIVE